MNIDNDFEYLSHHKYNKEIFAITRILDSFVEISKLLGLLSDVWNNYDKYDASVFIHKINELIHYNKEIIGLYRELETSIDYQNTLQDKHDDLIVELHDVLQAIALYRTSDAKKTVALLMSFIESTIFSIKKQNEYLSKFKGSDIYYNHYSHSVLFYLFDDANNNILNIKNNYINILMPDIPVEVKRDIPKELYTIEITPPVPNILLKRIYNEAYVPLFPDENERSDMEKLVTSLSQRYNQRLYHFSVLMCGNEPVGAVMFDYMSTNCKVNGKSVSFGALWYIYVLEEHRRKGTSILDKVMRDTLRKDELVKNDWFCGVFAEVRAGLG